MRRFSILCALASILAIGLTGCSATQQADIVQGEQQLAANASSTIDFAQKQVTVAQALVSAYQTQLALLPPGDKSAASMQKSLASAQGELVKAQLILSLARIGTDLLANVPAASNVQQSTGATATTGPTGAKSP